MAAANASGQRLSGGFGYPQAYKNRLDLAAIYELHDLLQGTWGRKPEVLDPTAGGGSIPFEALRLGLDARANDLNEVAGAVLLSTLTIPVEFGSGLTQNLREWGAILLSRLRERLSPFFLLQDPDEKVLAFIFARTIACPRTGKPVPLAPNWWLSKGDRPTAVRLLTNRNGAVLDQVEYGIATGGDIDFDPDRGTFAGGDALSPWDGLAIHGDHIKAEAQAGRMGSDLIAVAVSTSSGRRFRAPTNVDLDALLGADRALADCEEEWSRENVLPDEVIDKISNYERGHMLYGMHRWRDLFSPRQLLVHGTFVQEFRRLIPEVRAELGDQRGNAVLSMLGLMQGKALNYDSYYASWHAPRGVVRSTFDSHNFAFKWSYAEFEAAKALFPWCLDQLTDAYAGIAELLEPRPSPVLQTSPNPSAPGRVSVTAQNAADLSQVPSGSVEAVVIDPPYYDNVMYAELSDYFYVWEKRTLGVVRPELFTRDVTDKNNEAVANIARFSDAGPRKKDLANADYESKMAAIFDECRRVLRDDGVLTVMFTHKRAEAWDTLGMALLEAGFRIETSWPVNTESETSLHQANKNAAASTIFLVCRKRNRTDEQPPFFEDLESEVRAVVREAVERFSFAGLTGVDLLLSTYGPALSVISSHWPVYSSEADTITGKSRLLRPEEALDAARAEVVRLQRRRLVGNEVQLDPLTDFALIAWETFKAAEFPFDEARRLALATGGLDVDELGRARILEKKAGSVVLLPPEKRLRHGDDDRLPGVRPGATTFASVIDAVHTVMYVAAVDGLPAARALIDRADLAADQRFLACVQGLVNAIPRTRTRTGWARTEAEILDRLCAAYFPAIQMPPDPETAEVLDLGL